MADNIRRVFEIDAKIGGDTMRVLEEIRNAMKGTEDSAKKAAEAVSGMAGTMNAAGDKGARFIQSLKDQQATLGLSAKAINEYRAAQLDVKDAAQPFIDSLDRAQKALKAQNDEAARVAKALADGANAVKQYQQQGAAMVSSLQQEIALWGKDAEQIAIYKATLLGVGQQVTDLVARRNELKSADEQAAAAAVLNAKALADGAAAVARYREQGASMVAGLRDEIAMWGKDADAVQQYKATLLGVGAEVNKLQQERAKLRAADEANAKAAADNARALAEGATAVARYKEEGNALVANLQQQIAAWGKSNEAIELQKAALLGVGPLVGKLQQDIASLRKADEEAAAAAAQYAKSLGDGASAVAKFNQDGQSMLATLREEIVNWGKSTDELKRNEAVLRGIGPEYDSLIAKKQALLREDERNAAAQAKVDDANKKNEASARKLQQEGERLIEVWTKKVEALGKDEIALAQDAAAHLKVTSAMDPLIAKVREYNDTLDAKIKKEQDAKKSSDDLRRSEEAHAKAGDSYLKNLREKVATQDYKPAEKLGYEAKQLFAKRPEDLKEANALISQLKETRTHTLSASEAFNQLKFNTTATRRELLVLIHELSQGQYKRFGGSLLVLGEQMDATSLIMSKAGLAVIGFGGAVAGLGYLVLQGVIAQKEFNQSMLLTGNYAGQTAGSFALLADSVSKQSGVTIGVATEITQALISTGRFGPAAMQSVATAIGNLARISDKSAEEIVKDFEGMAKGVASWAKTHNEQYHFLTAAEYEYIRQLEEQGKVQEAIIATSDAFGKALEKQKENVGFLTSAWRGLTGAISSAKHAVEDWGKDATPSSRLADMTKAVEKFEKQRDDLIKQDAASRRDVEERKNAPRVKGTAALDEVGLTDREQTFIREKKIKDLNNAVERAKENLALYRKSPDLVKEQGDAAGKALDAKLQQTTIEGVDTIRSLNNSIRLGAKVYGDAQKYLGAIEQIKKNKNAVETSDFKELDAGFREVGDKKVPVYPSKQVQDQALELIRKKDQSKFATETESAVKALKRSLAEQEAALKTHVAQLAILGEEVNHATLAKVQADPALKGASKAVRGDLEAQAARIDKLQEEEKQLKAIGKAKNDIAAIKAVDKDEGPALNERDKQLKELLKSIAKTTTGYREVRDAAKEAIDAKFDANLPRKLDEEYRQIDEQARKIEEETSLIRLNSLEREKANAVLKIEADMRKLLRENPGAGNEVKIRAEAEREKTRLLPAIDARDKERRAYELDEEIKKIDEETRIIALNSFERQKAAAVYKIQEDARRRALAPGADKEAIAAETADHIDKITAAMDRNYEAQRRFETGATKAFNEYREAASDGSAFAGRIVSGGLQQMEDALTNFYKTGKLSLGGLFQFMADEFIRQAARMQISKLFSGKPGEGGFLGGIADIAKGAGDILKDIFNPNRVKVDTKGAGIGGANVDFRSIELGRKSADEAYGVSSIFAGEHDVFGGIFDQVGGLGDILKNGIAGIFGGAGGGLGGFLGGLFGGGGGAKSQAAATQAATIGLTNMTATGLLPTTTSLVSMQSLGLLPATAALGTFATALYAAATAAGAGSAGDALGGVGDILSMFSSSGGAASMGYWLAKGGVMSPRGLESLQMFASGGVMTRFGRLHPSTYSGGGVADRPQLALFGEGRKKEAYIPMDGDSVQIMQKMEGGQIKLYAPLPNGRAIPVTMTGQDRLAGSPYMQLPDGGKLSAFAQGGVMGSYGPNYLPIRAFADGGIGGGYGGNLGGDARPYVPGNKAPTLPSQTRGPGGNVYITIQNNADATVTTEESKDDEGNTLINFIIDKAVQASVTEVDRRLDKGGSTADILKRKGVKMNGGLLKRN